MPTLALRGIELYYEIQRSQGPAKLQAATATTQDRHILLIHGTGGDLRKSPLLWDIFHPSDSRIEAENQGEHGAATELSPPYRALAYDQRGLGRSSRPDMPYTMVDYAEDAAALLDALAWPRCSLVGFSFGGMVAQELALRYPEKFDKLVLISTSSGGAGGASYPLHELATLTPDAYLRRILALNDTRYNSIWQAQHPQQTENLCAALRTQLRIGASEPGRAIGARRQLQARQGHDCYARLPSLQLPTLICGGHYDGILGPENLAALHRQIPNSELQLFDGGHYTFADDPRCRDAIRRFVLTTQTPSLPKPSPVTLAHL